MKTEKNQKFRNRLRFYERNSFKINRKNQNSNLKSNKQGVLNVPEAANDINQMKLKYPK